MSNNEKFVVEKVLLSVAKYFDKYNKDYGYGNFIEKNNDNKYTLKDKKGLMQKILSDEENFEYILDNFPGFLMASGGNSQDVSSILIGRPSKVFKVKEEKDLESTLEKLCDDYRQKLNCLTLNIKGHALAVEGTLKKNGKTFFMVRNP